MAYHNISVQLIGINSGLCAFCFCIVTGRLLSRGTLHLILSYTVAYGDDSVENRSLINTFLQTFLAVSSPPIQKFAPYFPVTKAEIRKFIILVVVSLVDVVFI